MNTRESIHQLRTWVGQGIIGQRLDGRQGEERPEPGLSGAACGVAIEVD